MKAMSAERVFRAAGTREGEREMCLWGTWGGGDSHRLLSSCSSVYHQRCPTRSRCCETTASRGFRTKTKHLTQCLSPNNAITPDLLWKRANIEALAPPHCMMGFSFFFCFFFPCILFMIGNFEIRAAIYMETNDAACVHCISLSVFTPASHQP